MITIKSLDDLLNQGVDLILDGIEHEELHIEGDFTFEIKICGSSWDETIDYRTAGFILDLQRAINRLYREIHGDQVPLRGLSKFTTVKVKVSKGSSLINIDIGKAVEAMVGNMTGSQILIFTGIVAGSVVFGYTVRKILEYKERIKTAALAADKDTKVVDRLTSTIDKALDVVQSQDYHAPVRKLVSKLEPSDTIKLPAYDEAIPADVAKSKFPRKPKARQMVGIFDAKYTITHISLQQWPPEFTIEKGGLILTAAAELAAADIEQLTRDLEDALKKGVALEIGLHVYIIYSERRIIAAAIQGTGDPRENSEDIQKLIEMY